MFYPSWLPIHGILSLHHPGEVALWVFFFPVAEPLVPDK